MLGGAEEMKDENLLKARATGVLEYLYQQSRQWLPKCPGMGRYRIFKFIHMFLIW